MNAPFPLFLSIFIDPLCECLRGKNRALIISMSPVPNPETHVGWLLGKYLFLHSTNIPLGTMMSKITIIPILITFTVECEETAKYQNYSLCLGLRAVKKKDSCSGRTN